MVCGTYLSILHNHPSLADDHHRSTVTHHPFKDVEIHSLKGEEKGKRELHAIDIAFKDVLR